MEENVLNTILLEFQKLNERLDHIEKENENQFALIDSRFNTLEEIILSMQKDIGTLQEKVTSIENRISILEDRISQLENRMSQLEDIISQLEEKIVQIEDKISQLEERISSLEKITLRMEYTFNDKISALFDAHSYYSDQYQKLEARIRQNEMKVEKLSISHC